MRCPKCSCLEDKVVDTRTAREGSAIRRRRECLSCQHRFTTYEEIVLSTELCVTKNNGTREEFSPSKLREGVNRACWKRPVNQKKIDNLVKNVITKIGNEFASEINSGEIGEIIMEELKTIDEVAYIRFASVYRKFTDIEEFVNEINTIKDTP